MSNLTGKRALITHAGDGLGFVIAIALAQQNAEIVVHDNSLAVVGAAVERLALAVPGIKVSGIASDLAIESGVQQLLDAAGRIDLFVSDAVGEGATDFSQVSQAHDKRRETVALQHSEVLVARFSQAMSLQGEGRIFLLAPAAPGALTESQASSAGVKVFRLPVANLMLEPVADVIKSEVMRTRNSLRDVAEQIERDHRPLDIQKAAREISLLTQRITEACLT